MDFKHVDARTTKVTGTPGELGRVHEAVGVAKRFAGVLSVFGVNHYPDEGYLRDLEEKLAPAANPASAEQTRTIILDRDEVLHTCDSLRVAEYVAGMVGTVLTDPVPELAAEYNDQVEAYNDLRGQLAPAIRPERS